ALSWGLSALHSVAIKRRPVSSREASEARNTAEGCMISGCSKRAWTSAGVKAGTIPVLVAPPGSSILTRIRVSISSCAHDGRASLRRSLRRSIGRKTAPLHRFIAPPDVNDAPFALLLKPTCLNCTSHIEWSIDIRFYDHTPDRRFYFPKASW